AGAQHADPGRRPHLEHSRFLRFQLWRRVDCEPVDFPHRDEWMRRVRISDDLSFLAEMVFGADTTNEFTIDIERYQLTYRLNDYFSASAGRFHTAIGYYNTAYHHGNWFSTAEGRPIMYLFEDSGGVLPVHTVGATMTGLVPQSGKLGLHWIAEMGNGRASNPAAEEPVQNLYSDRNYRAFNFADYIRPEWVQGLQIGGSFYHDRLV